jgi:proteasome assembly chaperone (PAC2) family protein
VDAPILVDEPPIRPRILVAGLPDMGNVAGIAVEHLVKKLEMKVFAALKGSWPPFVYHKGGRVFYRRSAFRFYKSEKHLQLVVFTGDYQPHEADALYALAESVAYFTKRLGVERFITVGAAHRGPTSLDRVFYASTDDETAKEAEDAGAIALSDEGYITGFNGLLLGIGRELNISGICLLGEIDNPEIPQPRAAGNVLRVLAKTVGIETLDVSELEEAYERIRAEMRLAEEALRFRRGLGGVPPGVV